MWKERTFSKQLGSICDCILLRTSCFKHKVCDCLLSFEMTWDKIKVVCPYHESYGFVPWTRATWVKTHFSTLSIFRRPSSPRLGLLIWPSFSQDFTLISFLPLSSLPFICLPPFPCLLWSQRDIKWSQIWEFRTFLHPESKREMES